VLSAFDRHRHRMTTKAPAGCKVVEREQRVLTPTEGTDAPAGASHESPLARAGRRRDWALVRNHKRIDEDCALDRHGNRAHFTRKPPLLGGL
jgi:hypothetical protein